ncbi:TEX14 kinase, partial [Centropus unirufus]|nr:TEX14 kinase [Centropus unirufus]
MAHTVPLAIPCPVQLGSVKGDSLEAQLHEYVRQGNYVKVKKLLKKGTLVDAMNSMGQTSLFTAALLGLVKIVEVLLDYGADPNHRCYDGSTPVHAAAFSGNQWILSRLLDEGGDLRVHDKDGANPQCWAMSAGKESSTRVLEFIQRCTFHMQAALQNFPSDLLRKFGSSKALVYSPSRFGGLVQGNVDSPLGRLVKDGGNAARNIYSFGFGKLLHVPFAYALVLFQFYPAGSGHLGYLASLPVIGQKDVVQADDEPAFSYHIGPYMIMTNLVWEGTRVTVKELGFEPHQNCSKLRLADLLLAEQEHSSKLHHPHLLQLMAVCLSSDLEKTRLVYERVNFGSLYSILHERRTEFPVLHMETILHVLLQINDALRFIHFRGFIHRAVTSYAIQIVSSGGAKLCNLEYMIESKDGGERSDLTRIPVPVQLYRWSSPEVILEKVVTVKSDIYSFCTVVQEALTETPPWEGLEDSVVRERIVAGQQLEADVRLPKPYYDIVKSGLEPKQKNRSVKLQDIQYLLKNDLKDLTKSQTGQADELSKGQKLASFADVNICLASAFSCQKRTQELQGKAITEADSSPAPEYFVFPVESNALLDCEASTGLQAVTDDQGLELQGSLDVSDVDDSLRSFEINEIYASCPELNEYFLEDGAGLGQTLQNEKRQQKEEDKTSHRDIHACPAVLHEEKPVDEEGDFSESSTEYATEGEDMVSEASDLSTQAQVRGDAGRRMRSMSKNERLISECVLNLKIIPSILQEAADSLCRTEDKLDKLEASKKQKKLLQEIGVSQLSKQIFQDRHWNSSGYTSQSTNDPFSGARTFQKAIGPPSGVYVPPLIMCQGRGALNGESVRALSKTAKEMEAFRNEKWKCFYEVNRSENENNRCGLHFRVEKRLEDEMSLDHEVVLSRLTSLLPHVSVRCKKKLNLQCQRGGDSRSAARGSEEERWGHSKPRFGIDSTKISEEKRMMQSEWTTEVKEMARKVASGQLELVSPYPTSEWTSESEESVKEAFQHVTVRAQKSQDQQRYRWPTGDNMEPWDLGSEERSESEENDLDSTYKSSGGRSCESPSEDEQADSGIALHKNSVLPQEAGNLSRGHSRELYCSLSSPPDVSEEFFTPDPDYFHPPISQGSSELEVKVTEKAGMNVGVRAAFTAYQYCTLFPSIRGTKLLVSKVGFKSGYSNCQDIFQCCRSVTDIQDLSSIPCEQENYYRNLDCKTPRVIHAPTSVSTPLSSEEKIPLAFERYRLCYDVPSDTFFCGSQEISSESWTFMTAYDERRSTEIPSAS